MSWILKPEGDGGGRVRKRPAKLSDMPQDAPTGPVPGTPTKGPRTPGSVPGSPWAEFPMKDNYPKVPGPAVDGGEVSTKQANRPFLAYAQYREQKKEQHEAWLKRKEERELRLARGEDVGPEELDPTDEPEVGCLGLLKFIVISAVVILLAGKFFTGSYLWEHDLSGLRKYIPQSDQRLFSEQSLATFSGEVDGRPLYLAIDGDVYDVSANRATYGPGGSYHFMAGRDAARAFATGCFATHQTHDIRDLSDQEWAALTHWKDFFAKSTKYRKVGRVMHEPIDPRTPVPEPCKPQKPKEKAPAKASGAESRHDEL